ncbi:MAG: 6-phosphogluconolactonase, partial [Brevefilum sp.]
SGGSTPEPFYRGLADRANQTRLDWRNIHFFWGDERPVPPDHPDSNFGMAREVLIGQVPILEENVHRVPAEMDVRMAAFSYEEVLRDFFDGEWPRFDLVLLGMGEDGHTASLFPKSAGLNEEQRWFIANYAPGLETWRLTLTKHAINASREIWVLVQGKSKAARLAEALTGPHDPWENPIQLIAPEDGELVWMVDEDAAQKLPDKNSINRISG